MESKTPKPIFIIIADKYFPLEYVDQMLKQLEHKMPDYHVIFTLSNREETVFQVFYEKDYKESTVEEMKAYVREFIDSKK